jgi:hypothetical protein
MIAYEAIHKMAHISERKWEGTIYTISDIRYPQYNNKKIIHKIINGKCVYEWLDADSYEKDLEKEKP